MQLSTILTCALALGASAQSTTTYTDSRSGITVSGYQSASYIFGIALPSTPGKDFIGMLVGKGNGWAGVSLAGPMTGGSLLLVAWPNGQNILSSFRKATSYASPAVATGSFSAVPIASGTYVNSTHFVYTFLCKNCITGDSSTFSPTAETAMLGWALSTTAPKTPASATTAFGKHQTQGNYGVSIASTKTDKYDTWAALASSTTPMAFSA
ncbi:CBD9-like protein [Venustampulla echinocandica]|uniref:CBD9-like protein n=1 Tax=Venustampulla echinocandica TaxID=2656787 RepID=A0A370TWG9_9HELO|nr:CBD9-like protein [Venustampulla echinocandica]RDL39867.1 CBD9-like protein [Venustampulla echinocandica]